MTQNNASSRNTGSSDAKVKWSEQAWQAALPVYQAILELPFVKELTAGTLPHDKFVFYLGQDALYIENYCRVLAHIASRVPTIEMTKAFLDFAADGVAVEQAMHQVFLANEQKAKEMTPSCLLYCSLQNAQQSSDVAIEAASILPCFWVYLMVGKQIAAVAKTDNPYHQWIATYSDPAFEKSNDLAIALCDQLAENASEDVRRQMTDIFVKCTKMEWLFWHSAYNKEQWPV